MTGTGQAPDTPVPFGKITFRVGCCDAGFTDEESGSVRKNDCTRHTAREGPSRPRPTDSALPVAEFVYSELQMIFLCLVWEPALPHHPL